MKMKVSTILALLACTMMISCISCKNSKKDIDVTGIKLDIKIQRLEKDLFALPLDSIQNELPALNARYGRFFRLFNTKIIEIGDASNPLYPDYLKKFITDFAVHADYDTCIKVFTDLTNEEQKLTNAFKRYKYYFPGKHIPFFYSFVGGFNQSIVIDDSLIGIGLDKYLGANSSFYSKLGLSHYQRIAMNRSNIVPDCMHALALTEFAYNDSVDNLLSNMIYEGRALWFMKELLPEEPDSLIAGFSDRQLKWCEKYEKDMWTYLVEKKFLFSTDKFAISKFIQPGPYTKDFNKESPARAAVWIGYRIVKSYMENNTDITLTKLMNDKNYQHILTASSYEP
jgi:hypothetical protein